MWLARENDAVWHIEPWFMCHTDLTVRRLDAVAVSASGVTYSARA